MLTQLLLGLSPALAGLFAVLTGVLVYREYRRHRKRHPRYPIPSLRLAEFDARFRCDSLAAARQATVTFLANPDNELPATTSDLEAYVLATLARETRTMFEFGTCTGRTTYLWALNSPPDARIATLTLPPDDTTMRLSDEMRPADICHAATESTFGEFVYSGTPVAGKVEQLFQDSATLDPAPYRGRTELIFVDGGHSYAYVKNDSELALQMVAPGGLILWHDYRGPRSKETVGVYRYLNELNQRLPLVRLHGTSLVAYRAPGTPARESADGRARNEAA
jgi:predicted O-methyltransferase YrrM